MKPAFLVMFFDFYFSSFFCFYFLYPFLIPFAKLVFVIERITYSSSRVLPSAGRQQSIHVASGSQLRRMVECTY